MTPIAAAVGPASAIRDRDQDERAERVVRADPGLRVLRDLALEDGEPQRQVDGEPDPGAERSRDAISQTGAPEREPDELEDHAAAARACEATSGRDGLIRIATTPPSDRPDTADGRAITAQAPAPP